MQKITQRFFLLRKKVKLLALMCVLGFCFFQVISVPTASARAVNTVSDPSVIIVVDDTANSGCTKRIKQGIGTAHESVTTQVCTPGTILDTRIINKSTAITQHDAYVLLPPKNASVTTLKQAFADIQNLRNSKKASLRSVMMQSSRCVTGLTTLVASGYPGGDNGIRAIVDITYYNYCSRIFIDNISEEGVNVPNDYYYAAMDFYANDSFDWWSFSGCPSVNDAYSISLNINRTEPYGDYYVAGWLNTGIVSGYCNNWAQFYENQSSFLLN
jgi:hypothetical protein